jgi:hypothetical protein
MRSGLLDEIKANQKRLDLDHAPTFDGSMKNKIDYSQHINTERSVISVRISPGIYVSLCGKHIWWI